MGSGIGRFLRLTVSHIRLKIPYEDFPSTRRVVALVQVTNGAMDKSVHSCLQCPQCVHLRCC